MNATDFVQRWRDRARECPDCFDRFFSAWIALVIKARGYLDQKQLSQPDTDRIAILHYFEARAESVAGVLANLPEQTAWLARRRGTGSEEAILDVHPYAPEYLRRLFDELAQVWTGQAARNSVWVTKATAEMINHIRNNMFHGQKLPDDAADRELLERANDILLAVLEILNERAGRYKGMMGSWAHRGEDGRLSIA